MNYSCVIVKEGHNPSTNGPYWVIKTDSFMIIKGIKIEKGVCVKKCDTKEEALVCAKLFNLTINWSDRDT